MPHASNRTLVNRRQRWRGDDGHHRPGRLEKGADRQSRAGQRPAAVRLARSGGLERPCRRRARHPRWPAVRRSHADAHRKPGHLGRHSSSSAKAELDKIEKNLRPGTILNVGPTIRKFAEPTSSQSLRETPRERDPPASARLGVVPPRAEAGPSDRGQRRFDRAAGRPGAMPHALGRSSTSCSISRTNARCRRVRCTPSPRSIWGHRTSISRRPLGATPPAIGELAIERGTRHMGYDGKTGETLLKSVLAPMFAHRNLEVMSWVGHNIFGNMDGKVLDDPANKKSKVTSKDRLLAQILGYPPQTLVSIEYIAQHGRLENGLGPHPFPRLSGHADDAAIHLAGLRFAAGGAAGARSGAVRRAGLAPRRHRRADVPGLVLQEPAGHRRRTISPRSSRCCAPGCAMPRRRSAK